LKRRGLDLLRKALAVLPVVRANQGIRVSELARMTGIPEVEIVTDLPRLVNLCGVPPYSPMDLVDLAVEGDRVSLRFADQFRRPVRLTLREALALDMALSGWEEEPASPFAKAVAGIRGKVRAVVSPEVADEIDRVDDRISAVKPTGRAGQMLALLKEALSRQVEAELEYYSRSRGRLSRRSVRPYGIYEQDGHWYVAAHDAERDRVITLRADRIRTCELTALEYVIPDDFEVATLRREGPPDPEGAVDVEVRFIPDIARFAREGFPASSFSEEEDGSVVARLRTTGTAWLISELLRWGGKAFVVAPDSLREELLSRCAGALRLYGREG